MEASRRNGKLSRGPITEEGKARSARNNTKHGLAGSEIIVIEGESEEKWESLRDACIVQFRPANDLELEIVEEIAAARWRIRRSRAIETAMINKEIEAQRRDIDAAYQDPDPSLRHASAFEGLGVRLNLIDRYDVRVRRNYDRAVKSLYDLRARQQAGEESIAFPVEPNNAAECVPADPLPAQLNPPPDANQECDPPVAEPSNKHSSAHETSVPRHNAYVDHAESDRCPATTESGVRHN